MDARERHRLSHAQVQMARDLGMVPMHFGKIDNHDQEPWKMPLREFIAYLYEKRFGKSLPDAVMTIEEAIHREAEKKARKRKAKLQRCLNQVAMLSTGEEQP